MQRRRCWQGPSSWQLLAGPVVVATSPLGKAHTLALSATCSIIYVVQVARVAVSDEQWRAFRQAALARDLSVSAYLGRLVVAELKRRKVMAVGAVEPDAPEADQAIAALIDVRAAIDDLDAIARRLARSATAHGATWGDVAGSLRLGVDQAKSAYKPSQRANR